MRRLWFVSRQGKSASKSQNNTFKVLWLDEPDSRGGRRARPGFLGWVPTEWGHDAGASPPLGAAARRTAVMTVLKPGPNGRQARQRSKKLSRPAAFEDRTYTEARGEVGEVAACLELLLALRLVPQVEADAITP